MDSENKTPVSVLDLLDVARRRKFYAIVPALLVVIAVAAYAYTAPSKFRTKTLIAVEPGSDTGKSESDPSAQVQSHLRTIREVIFEGPLFQSVIQQFHLLDTIPAGDPARSLETLKSRVSIEIDGTDAFYIGYESADRHQAADVTNRIAELFVAQTSAKHQQQSNRETEVTETEVDRLRNKLTDLDSRIENYKQGAVEELPERVDSNLKQIEALQGQVQERTTAINNDESKRQGDILEMKDIEQKGMLNPPADPVATKSQNQVQLDAAKAKLDGLRTRYTPNNREVLLQEEQVRSLEKLVAAEPRPVAAHVVSPAELRYTQLKAEVAAIDKHLLDLRQDRSGLSSQIYDSRKHVNASPRHEQALAQLTREYDITKTEYETELHKQLGVRHDEQLQKVANNGLVFRIVEPAQVPLDPVSPKRIRLLAMGLVAGIVFGLGTAFLAEHVDSSFKDVDEFQTDTGLTVLSIIPKLHASNFPKRIRKSSQGLSLQSSDDDAHPAGTIVTMVDPQSVASEQFQILAMRIRNSSNGTKCPTILVTSSAGGEGKTVTSINLAMALSEQSHVLLIDADLRRPKVHEYLGLEILKGRGLGSLLFLPEDGLEKHARTVQGLTVLAGGDHVESPLALLTSPRLKVLMSRLRESFDFIVIDSPPIIPVADGIILGGFADHVALVVRAGYTPRAVLRRALESLDTSQIAGVVLNDVDTKSSRYAYAYKYYQASDRRRT